MMKSCVAHCVAQCETAVKRDWQPQCDMECGDYRAEPGSTSGAGQFCVEGHPWVRQLSVG